MTRTTSAIVLVLCATAAAQAFDLPYNAVTYNREFTGVETTRDDVFQVCFDRTGAVYPRPGGAYLITPDKQRMFRTFYRGRVEDYFREARISEDYRDVEPEVLGDYAAAINAALIAKQGATLVLLIHGFNNDYDRAGSDFRLCRERIYSRFPDRQFVFVNVYWDGLHGAWLPLNTGLPMYWDTACRQSTEVGAYGLRRLLNRVYTEQIRDRTVVLLSHGRGAGVVASALWQYRTPTPVRPDVDVTFDFARIRAGMIAPGLSKSAFDHCQLPENWNVVVGFNAADRHNRKFSVMPPGYFGSTRFGCVERIYHEVAGKTGSNMAMVQLNGKAHGFKAYMTKNRDVFDNVFLTALFE